MDAMLSNIFLKDRCLEVGIPIRMGVNAAKRPLFGVLRIAVVFRGSRWHLSDAKCLFSVSAIGAGGFPSSQDSLGLGGHRIIQTLCGCLRAHTLLNFAPGTPAGVCPPRVCVLQLRPQCGSVDSWWNLSEMAHGKRG